MSFVAFALRVLAAVVISACLFFASMTITLAVRGESWLTANAANSTDLDAEEDTSPSIEPLLSANPIAVATTSPSATPTVVETIAAVEEPSRTRSSPLPDLDPVFASLTEELDTVLAIPIRIPAELERPDGEISAHGSIGNDSYTIHIEQVGACTDSDACRIATFTGRRSVLAVPLLGTDGTSVPLPNGLSGRFSDGTCGLGCNNTFITWIEDGVRYSVGSSQVSGTEVLDLAWRSIDRSLPAPSSPEVCGPDNPRHEGQVANIVTTDVADDIVMHWIAVCSALGIDVEIATSPGAVRWVDVDSNGNHDLVANHADGTSTIYAVQDNRPRAVVDLATSERLRVDNLACVNLSGRRVPVDQLRNDRLDFVGPLTVQRIELTPSEGDLSTFPCT